MTLTTVNDHLVLTVAIFLANFHVIFNIILFNFLPTWKNGPKMKLKMNWKWSTVKNPTSVVQLHWFNMIMNYIVYTFNYFIRKCNICLEFNLLQKHFLSSFFSSWTPMESAFDLSSPVLTPVTALIDSRAHMVLIRSSLIKCLRLKPMPLTTPLYVNVAMNTRKPIRRVLSVLTS